MLEASIGERLIERYHPEPRHREIGWHPFLTTLSPSFRLGAISCWKDRRREGEMWIKLQCILNFKHGRNQRQDPEVFLGKWICGAVSCCHPHQWCIYCDTGRNPTDNPCVTSKCELSFHKPRIFSASDICLTGLPTASCLLGVRISKFVAFHFGISFTSTNEHKFGFIFLSV